MATRDLTVKEKVLRMVERLPEDVTYDRVLYHVEVMKAIEISLEQAGRGEVIPHEQVFAELLDDDAKETDRLDRSGKTTSKRSRTTHRPRRPTSGAGSRAANPKRGRKTKKPA
jgi:hypothetical protein